MFLLHSLDLLSKHFQQGFNDSNSTLNRRNYSRYWWCLRYWGDARQTLHNKFIINNASVDWRTVVSANHRGSVDTPSLVSLIDGRNEMTRKRGERVTLRELTDKHTPSYRSKSLEKQGQGSKVTMNINMQNKLASCILFNLFCAPLSMSTVIKPAITWAPWDRSSYQWFQLNVSHHTGYFKLVELITLMVTAFPLGGSGLEAWYCTSLPSGSGLLRHQLSGAIIVISYTAAFPAVTRRNIITTRKQKF